jgi:hypothetical protein
MQSMLDLVAEVERHCLLYLQYSCNACTQLASPYDSIASERVPTLLHHACGGGLVEHMQPTLVPHEHIVASLGGGKLLVPQVHGH